MWRRTVRLATWMRRLTALPYSQRSSVLSTSAAEAAQFPSAMEEATAHDDVLDLLQCYDRGDRQYLAQLDLVSAENKPSLLDAFRSVRKDIRQRLPRILLDLSRLPQPFVSAPSLTAIKEWYVKVYQDVSQLQEESFTDTGAEGKLRFVKEMLDNDNFIQLMSEEVTEMKRADVDIDGDSLQDSLEPVLRHRMKLRLWLYYNWKVFEKTDSWVEEAV